MLPLQSCVHTNHVNYRQCRHSPVALLSSLRALVPGNYHPHQHAHCQWQPKVTKAVGRECATWSVTSNRFGWVEFRDFEDYDLELDWTKLDARGREWEFFAKAIGGRKLSMRRICSSQSELNCRESSVSALLLQLMQQVTPLTIQSEWPVRPLDASSIRLAAPAATFSGKGKGNSNSSAKRNHLVGFLVWNGKYNNNCISNSGADHKLHEFRWPTKRN